jgi:circadian clock protein KaiC
MTKNQTTEFLSTGIPGIDSILGGGLARDRLYLIEGEPGTGKTTLALQFLQEGVKKNETCLYITLSETRQEIETVADSHGWSLAGLNIHEVIPSESMLDPEQQYTIFHPSEVELSSTTQELIKVVEKLKPTRVVLDSLSELQLLAVNPLRYRRQVLAFKQFFARRACTVLFLDDRAAGGDRDREVRSIAHGVISFDQTLSNYGATRRHIRVIKYRGMAFREGLHDYNIRRGGLRAYPRLVAAESRIVAKPGRFQSGLPELDTLLGGGIEDGTSTFLVGPPGAGKSSLSAQFVVSAVAQHEKAAMFIFEESISNLLNRCDGIGLDLRSPLDNGLLSIQQIDPAELTPGEYAEIVCNAADAGCKVIVIDSLNGYLNAMPDENFLTTHLHELLTYLGQRGVITILVGVQQGMLGPNMTSTANVSYLADNVIMLRYFEARGEVQQAISVFKKRGGRHERTIRQFSMTSTGIQVGPVLREFHGILSGIPAILDTAPAPLARSDMD